LWRHTYRILYIADHILKNISSNICAARCRTEFRCGPAGTHGVPVRSRRDTRSAGAVPPGHGVPVRCGLRCQVRLLDPSLSVSVNYESSSRPPPLPSFSSACHVCMSHPSYPRFVHSHSIYYSSSYGFLVVYFLIYPLSPWWLSCFVWTPSSMNVFCRGPVRAK
jgi:hypothetical protein